MLLSMDMGTTNTRLRLSEKNSTEIIDCVKIPVGAGASAKEGREYLFENIKNAIYNILKNNSLEEKDIEYIVVSGMGTSELGICEIEHSMLPYKPDKVINKNVPELPDIPFLFIPGLKKCDSDGNILDMMRGEETEAIGIMSALNIKGEALLILPGTHNKLITIKNGEITDFITTMSGEMLGCILKNTILSTCIGFDIKLISEHLLNGAAFSQKYGITAAAFKTRVLSKNPALSKDDISSFYIGAMLQPDIKLIQDQNLSDIYIGGSGLLKNAFSILLNSNQVHIIDDKISDNASFIGAINIVVQNTNS